MRVSEHTVPKALEAPKIPGGMLLALGSALRLESGDVKPESDTGFGMALTIINSAMSGVERAALDWALDSGLSHGGWCSNGRHADDAEISRRYELRETPTSKYMQALEWNVRDSDATLVLTLLPRLSGKIRRTQELVKELHKPILHLHRTQPMKELVEELAHFIDENHVETLHVTGSLESEEHGVDAFVVALLDKYADSGRFPWL